MFTGLVLECGRVAGDPLESDQGGVRLAIDHSPELSERLEIGASLAIAGVCLTLVEHEAGRSVVEMSPETLARTRLGSLRDGARVNLEPALRVGDALGGHWVQGHVDGVTTVSSRRDHEDHRILGFAIPSELDSWIVHKGSITLDGVSLTVALRTDEELQIALIPHTLDVTTMGDLEVGDAVNVEVDILAKYVDHALRRSGRLDPGGHDRDVPAPDAPLPGA